LRLPGRTEDVSMDVIFYNKGKSDENIRVRVSDKETFTLEEIYMKDFQET